MRSLALDDVRSQGYGFQIEMTLQALDAGGIVAEVPIAFREREAGVSKMSGAIIGEAFAKVAGWGAGRALARIRIRLGAGERATALR